MTLDYNFSKLNYFHHSQFSLLFGVNILNNPRCQSLTAYGLVSKRNEKRKREKVKNDSEKNRVNNLLLKIQTQQKV